MAEETISKRKVMVAIDESECSYYALKWTLENLRDCISTTPLLIFTAQPVPDFGPIYAPSLSSARMYCTVSTNPELFQNAQEQQEKVSLALLEKAKNICANHGIIAETHREVGDPREAICNAIENFNINLLILGNRGLGAIKRAFLGSVSDYCVHNSKCPVLVVKKPE